MKILLGDNQFFGVNHFDLEKGQATKLKFDSPIKIESFIKESLSIDYWYGWFYDELSPNRI